MLPEDLVAKHAIATFEKQSALSTLLGDQDHDWSFDIERGVISFNEARRFKAQVVGSESYLSRTWLWAWANDQLKDRSNYSSLAWRVHKYGRTHGISVLTDGQFGLDLADGHRLSMVALGILGLDCYYRGPYEGGAAYIVIKSKEVRRLASSRSPSHLVKTITGALSQGVCSDHLAAVTSYLEHKRINYSKCGRCIEFSSNGARIIGEFDTSNRLVRLSGPATG